jgi:hypothetical protein
MRAALILAAVLVASAARAQGAPPDIVRTRDGGMLRGTIIEKIPGDRVDIQLPNGQTRTVKMGEVEYAGPASGDLATPPPPPAPIAMASNAAAIEAPTARLQLKSDQRGLTYYRKMGAGHSDGGGWVHGKNGGPVSLSFDTANFERLCTAPCSVEVPQGTYKLGLSLNDGAVVSADALDLRGKLQLDGHYESNSGIRRAGWVVGIASILVGTVLALSSSNDCDPSSTVYCSSTRPYLVPGLLVMGVGGTLGLLMTFVGDDVTIRATPVP